MKKQFFVAAMMALSCLTACNSDPPVYAPVSDVNTIERIPKDGIYHATESETLYSVAWRYGLDYRYLAKRNHIVPPYRLEAGQTIYLRGKLEMPQAKQHPTKVAKISPPPVPKMTHPTNAPVRYWHWPAHGPVINAFSSLNKGINIGGKVGNPVYATAAGQVVYSGNGLRSYSNLVIIKHNNIFLSAYAYNSVVLVKQGDWVTSGQKIAEMGNTSTRRTMLHFEIRKNGKPVNPVNYLAKTAM